MSNDEYSQVVKISSSDGRNTVESFYNQLVKKADKAQVEYGLDLSVERIDSSRLQDPEDIE